MERRQFLKSAAAAGLAAASPATIAQKVEANRPQNPAMIYRELGTTGERVSVIGMGGFHLAKDSSITAEDAIRLVRSASDQGITFFDNCWDYNDGISEVRMGQALKDGYRHKAFVMTKLDARTAKDYDKQLEQSLGRLDTDVIDLVQFHEILRFEDPDRIFADDGAIHAAMAARKAGKIRYIGFTGHKDPQSICACSRLRRSMASISTRCRCQSMLWTHTFARSPNTSFRLRNKRAQAYWE
jgi:uncharacterized protein